MTDLGPYSYPPFAQEIRQETRVRARHHRPAARSRQLSRTGEGCGAPTGTLLCILIPVLHIQELMPPQNSEAVASLLSSVIHSFLVRHGFKSDTVRRPAGVDARPRKKRRVERAGAKTVPLHRSVMPVVVPEARVLFSVSVSLVSFFTNDKTKQTGGRGGRRSVDRLPYGRDVRRGPPHGELVPRARASRRRKQESRAQ